MLQSALQDHNAKSASAKPPPPPKPAVDASPNTLYRWNLTPDWGGYVVFGMHPCCFVALGLKRDQALSWAPMQKMEATLPSLVTVACAWMGPTCGCCVYSLSCWYGFLVVYHLMGQCMRKTACDN